MIRERSIERGYFISTGTFTQEARRFAEDKPLVLIDGDRLMDLVRIAESVDVSQERSKIHDNPNRTDYSCPTCSTRMLLRTMKGDPNGDQFWICSAYPACNGFLRKEGRGPLYFGY
jgi:restriction system protein